MVASSSIEVASDFGRPFNYAYKHGVFLLVACLAGTAAFLIPTRWWYTYATAFLLLSIVLLAIILIPGVGHTVKGATRWLNLGFFNLQPSEIAKFTMMLYLAAYLVRRLEEVRAKFIGFVKPMVVVGLISALLLLEPDFGTLMILSCAVMGVLLLAGSPLTQYMMIAGALILGLVTLAIIEPYRFERIETFSIHGKTALVRGTSSLKRCWHLVAAVCLAWALATRSKNSFISRKLTPILSLPFWLKSSGLWAPWRPLA